MRGKPLADVVIDHAVVIADDLDLRAVVVLEQLVDEVTDRVPAQIGREKADAQSRRRRRGPLLEDGGGRSIGRREADDLVEAPVPDQHLLGRHVVGIKQRMHQVAPHRQRGRRQRHRSPPGHHRVGNATLLTQQRRTLDVRIEEGGIYRERAIDAGKRRVVVPSHEQRAKVVVCGRDALIDRQRRANRLLGLVVAPEHGQRRAEIVERDRVARLHRHGALQRLQRLWGATLLEQHDAVIAVGGSGWRAALDQPAKDRLSLVHAAEVVQQGA